MISIPPSQREATRKLLAMSPEQMLVLAQRLEKFTPRLTIVDLAKKLDQKDEFKSLYEILVVLSSLSLVREQMALSPSEMAEEVIEAAQLDPDVGISQSEVDKLKNSFAELIASSEVVRSTREAGTQFSEHEHAYCPEDTRILSDIRGIFSQDQTKEPIAAGIVHMLKLAFYADGDQKSFFVALDGRDLRHLRGLLDVAIAREVTLEKVIDASQITSLKLLED